MRRAIADRASRTTKRSRGQTLAELGFVLTLLFFLLIGIMEVGYSLYQVHVVFKVCREGANLISRTVTFEQTETILRGSQPYPGPFDPNVKIILSVVRLGASGSANDGEPIITQRLVFGTQTGSSAVGNPSDSLYGDAPDYFANDPDDDTGIRATDPLPNGIELTPGHSLYVTEVFSAREELVSILPMGIMLPAQLYAAAYF